MSWTRVLAMNKKDLKRKLCWAMQEAQKDQTELTEYTNGERQK